MLRIIETFNNLPVCLQVDPRASFQPGQVGALKIKGGASVVGVCDGLHPCGIIDDIKSDVIRGIPLPPTQVHIVPANSNLRFDELRKEMVICADIEVELSHPNIIAASFKSSISGHLNSKEGIFTLPQGTVCNHCLTPPVHGGGVNDAVRFSCTYAYNVSLGRYDDSTLGSKRVTIWNKNMIAETDMYDTSQEYPKYSLLYAEHGLLTTKRIDPACKCIGVVLGKPSIDNSMLRFLLDLEGKVNVGSS